MVGANNGSCKNYPHWNRLEVADWAKENSAVVSGVVTKPVAADGGRRKERSTASSLRDYTSSESPIITQNLFASSFFRLRTL